MHSSHTFTSSITYCQVQCSTVCGIFIQLSVEGLGETISLSRKVKHYFHTYFHLRFPPLRAVQKLDLILFFFFLVQLLKVTNALCSPLHMRVSGSCGAIFSGRGRHIKTNDGSIISETELTLLQFYASREIIVSWAAANDY